MTVYVDECAEWGAAGQYKGRHAAQAERVGARHGHQWCHMFADEADCEELHAMAERIGLKRAWFQRNHYDLVPTKRALAVRLGAVEVGRRQSVNIWRRQRGQDPLPAPPDRAGGEKAISNSEDQAGPS